MTTRIPLTRGLVALVDDDDAERIRSMGKWHAVRSSKGTTWYARRTMRRADGTRTALPLHRFLTGWSLVDHINGDGLDNRRENLREATNRQNGRNRPRLNRNNTSGLVGVYWHKQRQRWGAQISDGVTNRHLGLFDTPEEAGVARDAAAVELHGEFARLNFPDRSSVGVEAARAVL